MSATAFAHPHSVFHYRHSSSPVDPGSPAAFPAVDDRPAWARIVGACAALCYALAIFATIVRPQDIPAELARSMEAVCATLVGVAWLGMRRSDPAAVFAGAASCLLAAALVPSLGVLPFASAQLDTAELVLALVAFGITHALVSTLPFARVFAALTGLAAAAAALLPVASGTLPRELATLATAGIVLGLPVLLLSLAASLLTRR